MDQYDIDIAKCGKPIADRVLTFAAAFNYPDVRTRSEPMAEVIQQLVAGDQDNFVDAIRFREGAHGSLDGSGSGYGGKDFGGTESLCRSGRNDDGGGALFHAGSLSASLTGVAKIMRPEPVWSRRVTVTPTCEPTRSLPPSTTTIVPSSRNPTP